MLIDAPVPGIGPWNEVLRNPLLWHFSFGGPDAERLVQGRERIYLDRFYNEFGAHPERIDEATRAHYAALYARPGGMHSAFAQFLAFPQDAIDNQVPSQTKLTIPVLAVGGEKSFGLMMAEVMRHAASDVRAGIVPDSGHWIMEENPVATTALVSGFLRERESAAADRRLPPAELQFAGGAGTGTSAVGGIQTSFVKGNPNEPGLYSIVLRIPAHTTIAAHDHPDDRVAVVLSGTWYFGYGGSISMRRRSSRCPPGASIPNRRTACISPRRVTSRYCSRSPASVPRAPNTRTRRMIRAPRPPSNSKSGGLASLRAARPAGTRARHHHSPMNNYHKLYTLRIPPWSSSTTNLR